VYERLFPSIVYSVVLVVFIWMVKCCFLCRLPSGVVIIVGV